MASKIAKILLAGSLLIATTAPAFAADRGDRINQRLDNRGDRIDERLDNRSDRAAANGHERRADRLDARGDRIEGRLDRKGNRIDRRIDRRHDRRS